MELGQDSDSAAADAGNTLPSSSKLGTKAHWDAVYEREVKVFHDIGDEGEVWFGEESAEEMVEWIIDEYGVSTDSARPTILDIGCGNAHLLLLLLEAGYRPENLAGVDYSPASIELSRAICAKHDVQGIELAVLDVLDERNPFVQQGRTWDCLTDKGTFDAIALSPSPPDSDAPHPTALYPARIAALLPPGGVFLITSCNFTEDELIARFATAESALVYKDKIPRAVFAFAGGKGQTVSTVAFVKQ